MLNSELIGSRIGDVEIIADMGGDFIFENFQGTHGSTGQDRLLVLAGRELEPDPVVTAQFRADLRQAARLEHPCLPAISDFGAIGSGTYIIYDWIDASTLTRYLSWQEDGVLSLDETLFITRQAASTLDHAHQNNLVHGFLTPENILVSRSGAVTIMRFGFSPFLSRVMAEEIDRIPESLIPYIAPEVMESPLAVSPAADIYALGRIISLMLTGALPESPDAMEALAELLPEGAFNLLEAAFTTNPAERPESVMAWSVAFEWACLNPGKIPPDTRSVRRPPAIGIEKPLPPARQLSGREAKREKRRLKAEARRVAKSQQKADVLAEKEQKKLEEMLRRHSEFEAAARGEVDENAGLPDYLKIDDDSAEPKLPRWVIPATAAGFILIAFSLLYPDSPISLVGGEPEPTIVIVPYATETDTVAEIIPETTEVIEATAEPEATSQPPTATPTPLPLTATEGDYAGETLFRTTDSAQMAFIPEGVFLMGTDDPARIETVRPQHPVSLSAYWIDTTEVTNAAYARCIDAGVCSPPINPIRFNNPDYGDHPVFTVNYEQSALYCRWLGDTLTVPMDLPTEAQWEKAATWDERTDLPRLYPWGDSRPAVGLLAYAPNGIGEAEPVGSYPLGASYYGVFDLSGNLWEWMRDYYDPDAYEAEGVLIDPTGPETGVYRSTRGGSWSTEGYLTIPTARNPVRPEQYSNEIGFRCALSADSVPYDAGFYDEPLPLIEMLIASLLDDGLDDGDPLIAQLSGLRDLLAEGDFSTAGIAADALLGSLDTLNDSPDEALLDTLRRALEWVEAELT